MFAAAARGDARAIAVVRAEAALVAKAICAIVVVADPELVVLGGGIGQAPGFVDLVTAQLAERAPNTPTVKVSALGSDAVVNGCLAGGLERAWEILTAAIPRPRIRRSLRRWLRRRSRRRRTRPGPRPRRRTATRSIPMSSMSTWTRWRVGNKPNWAMASRR